MSGTFFCRLLNDLVDRHKSVNPITLFTNIDEILSTVATHIDSLTWPKPANQTDPTLWTYDIGCNSDISVDYSLTDGVGRVFDFFATTREPRLRLPPNLSTATCSVTTRSVKYASGSA